MSVYSAKASSSSSSSSSSSASSSGSTGCFSETSFSSLSTIIAPQGGVRPFGDPDYNYFWIQNQSKTNPKASYYYNYKSHSVVWSRPLPKTIPLPLYSSAWVPEPKNISDGEEEQEVVVSDPEDAFQKKRRLQIKQRNRRLIVEDRYRTADVLSVDNTVKCKKRLDVFWKLYRLPGESVEDMKNRLLKPTENEVVVKTEVLSDEDEQSKTQDLSIICIKKEPEFYNDTYDDYSMEVQEASQSIIEHEEDSDSDPDNVDFLIQQDYNAVNSDDSEMEKSSCNENGSDNNSQDEEQSSDNEEEESSWDSNDDSEEELRKERRPVENYFYRESSRRLQNDTRLETNIDNSNLEEPEEVDNVDEECMLSNILEVEISEEDKENICSEISNTAENEEIEEVDWYFEKSSEPAENSLLTRAALNPVYKVSKPKPIVDKKKNKKPTKTMPIETRRVPKIIIKKEPYYHIKQEPDTVTTEPVVYEMYGTRTTNYDHYTQSKEARSQSCTGLSDSSSEESVVETIAHRIRKEPRRASQHSEYEPSSGEQGVLELKNWFPKSRGESRKRKNSDKSWIGSDLSDYLTNSSSDESNVRGSKRKRRSSTKQEEFQPESKSSSMQQEQALTSAMDPSTVKVELCSSMEDLIGFTQEGGSSMQTQEEEKKEEEEEKKDVVKNEKPKVEENDATTDSESDSSSCCSRSSCSCSSSSSSSSSSSDDENDKQAKKEDL